jgi:hypothetical protein
MPTLPCAALRHDQWKHAAAALEIAESLARLCFDHALPHVDPQTRLELMQLADEAVSKAVDEHALAEVIEFDSLDAWKYSTENKE